MKMRDHRVKFTLFLAIPALTVFVFAVALKIFLSSDVSATSSDPNQPSDGSHFISFFDNDDRINVRSDADTVRDALARAEIELSEGDKVEPALDEPIAADDFNINIYRARERVVVDGVNHKYVKTASMTPEEIVADAGIQLLDADQIELVPYDGFLESGIMVAYKVKRAKVVHVDFYGKSVDVRTQAKTVGAFLEEQNIENNPEKNWISIATTDKVYDGLKFSILPQGVQTVTVEEDIPFGESVTQDYDLAYGKREVTKQGETGRKTVTYEVNMHDGQELSRNKISEIVNRAPVNQEVRVGAKVSLPSGSHEDWMAAAGISPSDFGYVNFIITHESNWNPASTNGRYWGLYQTTTARLIGDCGEGWVNDPVCQLRSATGYAVGRYGSWESAYNFWVGHYWW